MSIKYHGQVDSTRIIPFYFNMLQKRTEAPNPKAIGLGHRVVASLYHREAPPAFVIVNQRTAHVCSSVRQADIQFDAFDARGAIA